MQILKLILTIHEAHLTFIINILMELNFKEIYPDVQDISDSVHIEHIGCNGSVNNRNS